MSSDFNHKSYELHQQQFDDLLKKPILDSWKRKDTVDYWRHECMYRNLLPLIQGYPDARWLTVGDGRYGTDANYLISQGLKNVVASDLSDTLLRIAKQDGFITEYAAENAEKMSFADGSFDFVLCKEAYHHFPRPAIAFYEMLRVARKAVILIEPMDKYILFNQEGVFKKIIRGITNACMLKLKGINHYENFEEVGNYIFTTSEREINKMALALNLKATYFKYQNDDYILGAEEEPLADKGPVYQAIVKKVARYDMLCKMGLMQYALLTSIVPKQDFDPKVERQMFDDQYFKYSLARNPYV